MGQSAEARSLEIEKRLAATQIDEAEIFFELGLIYATGVEVERDLVEAHKWLNLAVMRGHRGAQQERAELAGEMTSSEIAHAQRIARQWLEEPVLPPHAAQAALSRAA